MRLMDRYSGKCCDEGLAVGENPDAGVGVRVLENNEDGETQVYRLIATVSARKSEHLRPAG